TSSVATTSGGDALARRVEAFGLPEAGAVTDCAWSTDRPAVSAMSVAMVVFIVFPFNSLRPVARLGHEAVDKAVERSESWGAADEKRTRHVLLYNCAIIWRHHPGGHIQTHPSPHPAPLRGERVPVGRVRRIWHVSKFLHGHIDQGFLRSRFANCCCQIRFDRSAHLLMTPNESSLL